MKSFLSVLLLVPVFGQTPLLSPTPTPMGSSMFAYPLSFPNSDPAVVAHPDRLVYFMNAVACAANVSAELVYISYIRADYNIVTFEGPPHDTLGLVKNCSSLMPPISNVIASKSMLVRIYYTSPRPANPNDIVFRNYAAATGSPITVGYSTESSVLPTGGITSSLSAGDIVGIVGGVIAAASLIALAYAFYVYRDKPSRPATNTIVVNPTDSLIFFQPSRRDLRGNRPLRSATSKHTSK
jgi:hypothetical protein